MAFTGNYVLRGKHATYALYLCKDKGAPREGGINIFERVIDLYLVAPIFGICYDRKSSIDSASNDRSTIQYEQIEREKLGLQYVYRLILMYEYSKTMEPKEAVEAVFKYIDDDEKTMENDQIYNEYVLGGIEYLYEYFSNDLGDEEVTYEHILELINAFDDEDEIDDY